MLSLIGNEFFIPSKDAASSKNEALGISKGGLSKRVAEENAIKTLRHAPDLLSLESDLQPPIECRSKPSARKLFIPTVNPPPSPARMGESSMKGCDDQIESAEQDFQPLARTQIQPLGHSSSTSSSLSCALLSKGEKRRAFVLGPISTLDSSLSNEMIGMEWMDTNEKSRFDPQSLSAAVPEPPKLILQTLFLPMRSDFQGESDTAATKIDQESGLHTEISSTSKLKVDRPEASGFLDNCSSTTTRIKRSQTEFQDQRQKRIPPPVAPRTRPPLAQETQSSVSTSACLGYTSFSF